MLLLRQIFYFLDVPPLVLNAKRMIGIATLDSKMEISFSVEDDNKKESNVEYFKKAMSILEALV